MITIKKRLNDGEIMANIARDYTVDRTTIRQIRDGKTWKSVG